MPKLTWDGTGEREYQNGVDRGVLFPTNDVGEYQKGVAWNGLTAVTDSPSGAEVTKLYADNQVYASLVSAETFGGTIAAYTYPDEFEPCNGGISPTGALGVVLGQQSRRRFGFAYRSNVGNDTAGQNAGYKLHLIYGCLASPSETAHNTINDSPEAAELSWEYTSEPVSVEGFKPVASLTLDSITLGSTKLKLVEDRIYGSDTEEPTLLLPTQLIALISA